MDKNNFSEIYKKYVMTAYSAAMQVVHNEADADDIAQETMVKLYLNIDALDEDRVEGWVRVAAKNLGIDYQRKAQRFDWNVTGTNWMRIFGRKRWNFRRLQRKKSRREIIFCGK